MPVCVVDRIGVARRDYRNLSKIKAKVLNTKVVVAIGKTPDRFRAYRRSLGPASEATAVLRKRFRYLGDHGTYYFLWSVGEKVPPWDEWRSRPSKAAARTKAKSRKPSAKPPRA